jgi:aminoglycoside phosphotransferase (APT) family kinase protein
MDSPLMTASKDSVAVRAGEELDPAALNVYLRDRLTARYPACDRNSRIEIEQFPGGHSNLTYLIRYDGQEFVLRRPPVGPVAPKAHDIPREFNLLSMIHPRFPLAPKPLLLCEDTSIIGVPFYLMERRRGLVMRAGVTNQAGENLPMRRRLSETMVDTLIALHAVDIYSSSIVNIGKPEGFVTRQVHGWTDRWQRSKTSEIAEMDQVINWLAERIPPDPIGGAAIVHNDFKLDNIMLDADDPTRVVAVLDWEMCTVGDPLVDLGLFLGYWTMKGGAGTDKNSSLRAVTNEPGWMTRQEIIDRYQTRTKRDLSAIVFYETFARFKVAVVIQQIYFRYVKGQTRDERFRNFDGLVSELTRDALELAQRSGI